MFSRASLLAVLGASLLVAPPVVRAQDAAPAVPVPAVPAPAAPAPAAPAPKPKFSRYDIISAVSSGNLDRVKEILAVNPEYINGTESQTPVTEAINNGNVEILVFLLDKGADPNASSWNSTALWQALSRYDDKWRAMADALVAKGANINATDYSGQPLLQQLLQYGGNNQKERVAWMLDHKINIYAPARGGSSLLDVAITSANTDIAKLVLDKADVKWRDQLGQTPLFGAVRAGKIDLVRAVLERGSAINAQNAYGDTPLHVAARGDGLTPPNSELIKLLLDAKANPNLPNARGDLPLHLALRRDIGLDRNFAAQTGGYQPLPDPNAMPRGLQLVPLINQTDINIRDGGGMSPLLLTVIERDAESRDLIRDRAPKKDSTTALFDAIAGGDTANLTKILTAKPYLTFFRLPDGSTPLHVAALWGTLGCATELLKCGADVNARDVRGFTPLHYVVRNPTGRFARRALNMTTFLLVKGANVNLASPSGDAPLHLAARAGAGEIINVLLAKGARIDARGLGGETPLLILTNRSASLELYKTLLDKGAKADVSSASGVALDPYGFGYATSPQIFVRSATSSYALGGTTPLHRAVMAHRADLILALLAKGANIDAPDAEGKTPLALAVSSSAYYSNEGSNAELVTLLLSRGANPNVRLERNDLLSFAVERGDIDVTKALLTSKKVALKSNAVRNPPLFMALNNGRTEIVRALLEAGADPTEPDANGRTPLEAAYSEEMKKLINDRIAQIQAEKAAATAPAPPAPK